MVVVVVVVVGGGGMEKRKKEEVRDYRNNKCVFFLYDLCI